MRYYHQHLLIACAVSLVTLSPTAGAMFYVGREWVQFEMTGAWDRRGLLWPVIGLSPLIVLEMVLKIVLIWRWTT